MTYKTGSWGIQAKLRGIKRIDYFKRYRILAVESLGGKCKRCGFSDFRALQIDHINGRNGDSWSGYNSNIRHKKVLKDNGKNYQLLCANCNWIKRYENKEQKHQKEMR